MAFLKHSFHLALMFLRPHGSCVTVRGCAAGSGYHIHEEIDHGQEDPQESSSEKDDQSCYDQEILDPETCRQEESQRPKGEKLSALDAAARALGESKEPLNAKQMIETMAAKGYWSSPGGKTPHATLYAAIVSEITLKGKETRFKKTERGHFTLAK